jgi:ribose 5-phosphate isomerase B
MALAVTLRLEARRYRCISLPSPTGAGSPRGARVEAVRIAIAADHAGLPLKGPISDWLRETGHEVEDFGVEAPEPVDYPDIIAPAARAVAAGECELGIVLGGSGTGEQIVANKIRGIRCVEASEPVTARLGREHNDANVLAMGARIVGVAVALACVEAFVTGQFHGGRHARRVAKIAELEATEQGG